MNLLSIELLLEINITFAIMLIFHEFTLTSDWANKNIWHAVWGEGSEIAQTQRTPLYSQGGIRIVRSEELVEEGCWKTVMEQR